jgi:hypothetical protein
MGGGLEVDAASAESVIASERCCWMIVGWDADAASSVSVVTTKQSGNRCKKQSGHRCERRRAKAKSFHHEGFTGDA